MWAGTRYLLRDRQRHSAVALAQSGSGIPAALPNPNSSVMFCQQNWGDVPLDVQSFINQLCVQ
jgi:hypothetical protein